VDRISQIEGFEYEITESGLIYSLPLVIMRSNGRPQTVVRRQLSPYLSWSVVNGKKTKGHLQVDLKRDKKRHQRYVHTLVLETFLGPRPDGMQGLHRDDDPYNNHVSNLYWGTMKQNAVDREDNRRCIHCGRHPCR